MKKAWVIILTVIVIAGLIFAGFYYSNKQNQTEKDKLQSQINDLTAKLAAEKTVSPATTSADTTDDTSSWKTYTNEQFGFSIKYPSNYTAENASSYTPNDGVFIYSSNNVSQGPLVSVEAQSASGSLDVNVAGKTSDGTFTEATKTTLGEVEDYEGVSHGESKYYGIITIKSLKIVEIICNTDGVDNLAASKAVLTATQKQIISTFQFTK